ncbi:4Fe-4S dicluster domain-containing protein [Thermodesulfovibrio sp.]|uniref:4Fe-4S dicluster domain-containing protein n=2 Tax=Thermodesulfovibrio TaxID=28261 RepID=UPI0026279450|nr:4Fe-4S dicluster domain-containing protein [Thermodesulfovibrio sp.]
MERKGNTEEVMDRREFIKKFLASTGMTVLGSKAFAENSVYSTGNVANRKNWLKYEELKSKGVKIDEPYAILVDLTKCIGCRRCEWACNEWNKNPNSPLVEFEESKDKSPSVFDRIRRPHAGNFTVVNRFSLEKQTVYVKKQCMHCLEPACLSACFVNAFSKTPQGAVLYNPSLCVGCRYCMIACPFDIPAYEYYDPLTPQITKCTMCFDRISEGKIPACVEVCSADVMIVGNRSQILKLAHEKINTYPERYIPHVYGEHEGGGTSWLYISSVPFEKLGFPKLNKIPIPTLSKNFLYSVKIFEILAAAPLVWGAYYMIAKSKKEKEKNSKADTEDKKSKNESK